MGVTGLSCNCTFDCDATSVSSGGPESAAWACDRLETIACVSVADLRRPLKVDECGLRLCSVISSGGSCGGVGLRNGTFRAGEGLTDVERGLEVADVSGSEGWDELEE